MFILFIRKDNKQIFINTNKIDYILEYDDKHTTINVNGKDIVVSGSLVDVRTKLKGSI